MHPEAVRRLAGGAKEKDFLVAAGWDMTRRERQVQVESYLGQEL